MNIRRLFSLKHLTTAVFYGVGLFGMHIALLIAVFFYIPSRFATIPFRGLVLAISIWAIIFAVAKGFSFYKGKLWWALGVFWAFYALAIFMEPSFTLQQSRMDYSLYAFGICAIPSLGFLMATTRSNIRSGMIWLYAAAFVAGVMSLILYGGGSLHGMGRAKSGEFIGDFAALSPLLISYTGSVVVLLGVYWILVKESLPSIWLRYLIAGCMLPPGAYLMALGASRGPVLAVLLVIIVFILSRFRKLSDIFILGLGLLFLLGGGFLMLFFADATGSALVKRLESLLHIQETLQLGGTGVARIGIYQLAFQQFLENPILGSGLYLRAVSSYPHNFILEAYMTTGVFGGTAFLIYFCTCCFRAIKIIRYFQAYSWVSLFFLHYAVYVQLSSGIITNHYFWYSSAMVIAVYEFVTRERLSVHPMSMRHDRR